MAGWRLNRKQTYGAARVFSKLASPQDEAPDHTAVALVHQPHGEQQDAQG